MFYFVLFSATIGILSTFAFSGNAFNRTENFTPSIFDLAFGNNSYPRYNIYTSLFVLQIFVILSCIALIVISFLIKIKKVKDTLGIYFYLSSLVIFFAAFIIILSSLKSSNIRATYDKAEFGLGSSLYLICLLISLVTLLVRVYEYFYSRMKRKKKNIGHYKEQKPVKITSTRAMKEKDNLDQLHLYH